MISLPQPDKTGGMPLMDALSKRCSSRSFSSKELDLQTLSNLLWAACGVNRLENGLRTAPSAVNWQEIEVYICLKEGVYLYKPNENTLLPYMDKDIREATGRQPFVRSAPLCLIYVVDFNRIKDRTDEMKHWYSAADTAFIAQNVYLFCASSGLANVVIGAVDKSVLKNILNLPEYKHVTMCHCIGYHNI
jgi:SagB-type dehydrogenase family enzyme